MSHSQARKIALVIAVNDVPNSELLSSLLYAELDACDFSEAIQSEHCGFSLSRPPIIGSEATTETVRKAILSLQRQVTDEDIVIVYFSGHAMMLKGEADREDAYLATSTFDEREVFQDENAHLSFKWLREQLYERIKAKQVLIILDCCYSGEIARSGSDAYYQEIIGRIKMYFDSPSRHSGARTDGLRLALTATSHALPASESDGRSMTRFIVPAIKGEIDRAMSREGVITIHRLYDYLLEVMYHKPSLPGNPAGQSMLLAHFSGISDRNWPLLNREYLATSTLQVDELKVLLHDHSGFINDRISSFVGRQNELEDIRTRISDSLLTGGYITITGHAGQGKSSIIAKLVSEQGVENVAHHFIPFNPGPDHQIGILRNIMARLIVKYGLSSIFVNSDNRSVLRDYFTKLLNILSNLGAKEVIFIDGLDQIEEDITGVRDLSFLPENAPVGIVFVLGTRPNDTLLPLELRKPSQAYWLPNLSRNDFDLILQRRGVVLDPALASRFYDSMQGNALYLDLAAKEVSNSTNMLPDVLIAKLADDPGNIFSITIGRLKQNRSQWRSVLKPMLGVLLASMEPLSSRALRSLIGEDDEAIREGLQRLGGLLAIDQNSRYFLYHLKLREFLQHDKDSPKRAYVFAIDEVRDYHKRLVAWCDAIDGGISSIWIDSTNNTFENEVKSYARQHYITHIYHSRDRNKLWMSLDSVQYGRNKLRFDPSTRAFAHDLDLGRAAASESIYARELRPKVIERLWRYTLLRTSLSSLADRISDSQFITMVRTGKSKEAIGLAELITYPERKARMLCHIAKQILYGNSRDSTAHQLLIRATDISRGITATQIRSGLFESLSIEFALIDDMVNSMSAINEIPRTRSQVNVLCQISKMLTAKADTIGALTLAERAESRLKDVTGYPERVGATIDVMTAYALMGDWGNVIRVRDGYYSLPNHYKAIVAVIKTARENIRYDVDVDRVLDGLYQYLSTLRLNQKSLARLYILLAELAVTCKRRDIALNSISLSYKLIRNLSTSFDSWGIYHILRICHILSIAGELKYAKKLFLVLKPSIDRFMEQINEFDMQTRDTEFESIIPTPKEDRPGLTRTSAKEFPNNAIVITLAYIVAHSVGDPSTYRVPISIYKTLEERVLISGSDAENDYSYDRSVINSYLREIELNREQKDSDYSKYAMNPRSRELADDFQDLRNPIANKELSKAVGAVIFAVIHASNYQLAKSLIVKMDKDEVRDACIAAIAGIMPMNNAIEEFNSLYNLAIGEITRIRLLCRIAELRYRDRDIEATKRYLHRSLLITENMLKSPKIAESYSRFCEGCILIADTCVAIGRIEQAKSILTTALRSSTKSEYVLADAATNQLTIELANVYALNREHIKAVETLNEVYKVGFDYERIVSAFKSIFQHIPVRQIPGLLARRGIHRSAALYTEIARAYYNVANESEALKWLRGAEEILYKNSNNAVLVRETVRIASLYALLNDNKNRERILRRCLGIFRTNTAIATIEVNAALVRLYSELNEPDGVASLIGELRSRILNNLNRPEMPDAALTVIKTTNECGMELESLQLAVDILQRLQTRQQALDYLPVILEAVIQYPEHTISIMESFEWSSDLLSTQFQ